MTLLAIVRVRGGIDVKGTINRTIRLFGLVGNNHCVVVQDSKILQGMLKKSQDYITYGEISKEVLKHLILKRGRLKGNKKITTEWLKSNKQTEEGFVELFEKDQKKVYELGLKKVFRLSPPSKGFERKGIKQPFAQGGALGNRKEKINALLKRMI